MMHKNNMMRFAWATLAGLVVGPGATGVGAQTTDHEQLPDAAGVVEAWNLARSWVRAYEIPKVEDDRGKISIPRAAGVHVMLRFDGEVMGEGTAQPFHEHAVRDAVRHALSRLHSHPRVAEVPLPLRPTIGEQVTVELEVAGRFIPIVGSSFDEVASKLRPGLDGFAMRSGDEWVVRFPSQLRATNNSSRNLSFLMQSLLTELDLRRKPLLEHRQQDGLSVYRFSTIHLAQSDARAAPFTTYRGEKTVETSSVDRSLLIELATMVASHVATSEIGWTPERPATVEIDGEEVRLSADSDPDPPLGLAGAYVPVLKRYEPIVASPLEQAMASLALSRFAGLDDASEEARESAAALGERILFELGRVVQTAGYDEPEPTSNPAASAMIVLAARALKVRPRREVVELSNQAEARVWASFDRAPGAFERLRTPDGAERELTSAEKAMVAYALARLAVVSPPTDDALAVARQALDAAWGSTEEVDHVSLMPWIGWGEMEYSLLGGASPMEEQLQRLRASIEQSQLIPGTTAAMVDPIEPDLYGGYVLAGESRSSATSQGLRPAAWLARALGDPTQVSEDDLPLAVAQQMQFARFLAQLIVMDRDAWAYPDKARASGGVNNAPWDSVQPLPAQSLALLTLVDLVAGLDRFIGG